MSSGSHERRDYNGPAALATGRRLLDGIAWFCMLAAGLGLVFIVASYGWLVFSRYILNDTPTWIGQLSLLMIVWVVFLGTAVGVYRHTHLSIEFMRDMLPWLPRLIIQLIADILIIVFGAFLAWQGWIFTLQSNQSLQMLGITAAWRTVPTMICGILIIIFAVFEIIERPFIRHGNSG